MSDFFILMEFFVYILYSEKCDKYYVGHTEALDVRLKQHNGGTGGTFSSSCLPWKLVYSETYSSRSEAMKREKEIKKWRREKKNALVETINPQWKDLSEGWYS